MNMNNITLTIINSVIKLNRDKYNAHTMYEGNARLYQTRTN